MDFWYLIKGIIVGLAVSIPLGPIGILCVQRVINKSWRSGFYSGLGAAISDTIYAIVAGFSLTYIINFIKENEFIFQVLGALILLVLGIHIYSKDPVADAKKYRKKGTNYLQDFMSTFIITFSNPLAVLIFLAVFAGSGIVLKLSEPINAIFVVMGVFIGATGWWLGLTSLVNMLRHKFNLRILWWFNRLAGIGVILFVVISMAFIIWG